MNPQEAGSWMARYYLAPVPDQILDVIRALAEGKVLKGQKVLTGISGWLRRRTSAPPWIDPWQPGTDAPLIAFVAKVFGQNPSRVGTWLEELQALPEGQQRSLWIAVWLSRAPGVDVVLRERAQKTSKAALRFVDGMLSQLPQPIEALPLTGPVVLDMNWAAFFATGDEKYVLRVVEALGAVAFPKGTPAFALGTSALWSLQSNAKQHPRVREACAAVLPQTTDGMRMMLESIVSGAVVAPPSA